MNPLIAAFLAAVVSAVATPLAMWLARRTGVLDHPGPLKPHVEPVPYLGGAAVFCGLVAVGGADAVAGSSVWLWLVPLTLAVLLGTADDVASLSPRSRLLAELAVGGGVAWSVGLSAPVAIATTVVVTVVLVNAVNFVDGIDGLAAGVTAVAMLGLAVVSGSEWALVGAAGAGAAAGFLLFNRPPARIYLGDAGSYLLGTILAVLIAAQWTSDGPGVHPVLLTAIVGYPLVELVSTVARRLLNRRPLFAGDRDHVYDRWMRSGRSGPFVAGTVVIGQVVGSGLAVAAHALDSAVAIVAVAGMMLAVTAAATATRSRA